jgi:hypothetical protein
MSEARPNAHRTRRGVARISVAFTAAAIATLVAISGGLAQNNQGNNQGGNSQGYRGAPAPAIGSGLSTFVVVGGVLLGATLFRRRGQAGTAGSVSD